MKAIHLTRLGDPDVLQLVDVAEPVIERPTQIKVKIKAAGVNPVDTKLRKHGVLFPDALPTILGCDGAGVVVELGTAATRFRLGDEVWFCHGGLGREQGNYAEFTVIEQAQVQPKPRRWSFAEAAAAPLVLITAWEALHDRSKVKSGQTVLIHGGAGGVGHVAIQIAKLSGATVIATVGSEEHGNFARELGADEVIQYTTQDFVQETLRLTDNKGADIVLDTVGEDVFRRSIDATAYGGDVVTLLEPSGDANWKEARMRNLRIGFVLMLTPMVRDLPIARVHQVGILRSCGQFVEANALQIHVDRIFPLQNASDAHRFVEAGHTRGKAVLSVD